MQWMFKAGSAETSGPLFAFVVNADGDARNTQAFHFFLNASADGFEVCIGRGGFCIHVPIIRDLEGFQNLRGQVFYSPLPSIHVDWYSGFSNSSASFVRLSG